MRQMRILKKCALRAMLSRIKKLSLKNHPLQKNAYRTKVRNATCNHQSKHLEENSVYDAQGRCPICLHSGKRVQGIRLQSDPAIHLLHCPACGGRSAAWMPKPEVLQDYYSGYFETTDSSGENSAVCVTFQGIDRFARHLIRAMPVAAGTSPVRILDYGGGDGSLALAIAKHLGMRAVSVTLVDYQKPRAMLMEQHVSFAHFTHLSDVEEKHPGQKFDIVLASAVLEHIPEVNAALKTLFGLIQPGGYFYARTPYMSNLIRFFPFIDFVYPAHVHDLGASFWNRITNTFQINADLIISRPSIVESEWSKAFMRTLVAYVLKLPARLEGRIAPRRVDRWWNLVGGWEVVLRANL